MVTRNPDMRVRSVELTAIGELQGAEHPSNRLLKTIGAGRHHLGGSDKRNNHQEYRSGRDLRTRFGRISSCSGDNLQGSFTETPFFRSLLNGRYTFGQGVYSGPKSRCTKLGSSSGTKLTYAMLLNKLRLEQRMQPIKNTRRQRRRTFPGPVTPSEGLTAAVQRD